MLSIVTNPFESFLHFKITYGQSEQGIRDSVLESAASFEQIHSVQVC